MKRSIFRVLIILLCLVNFQVGNADLPKTPDRYTFLLAQDRILETFKRGNPIYWSINVQPDSVKGYELGTLDLLRSIVSKMELSGVLQSDADGSGWIDCAVLMNDERISSFSQITQDGRIGMQLNSDWFTTTVANENTARSMLSFDPLGESLLSFPYNQIRSMGTPFIAPLSQIGLRLWELASPWSKDNEYLTASSGATSHGITYSIDTNAARSILRQWVDELSIEQFQYGLINTDFWVGIDEETFDQFTERMRVLSQSIELPQPLVINMAFGEGDALGNARGSGPIKVDGKRSDISIKYTRESSNSRIKYRLTLDFQPKQGDTLVMDLSVSKSSNQKSSGAYEVKFSASGIFDGRPYQIRYNCKLDNTYQLADSGPLYENITGNVDLLVKYDNVTVAELSIHQDSRATSTLGKKNISIQHTYLTTLKNNDGLLFSGPIIFSMETKEDPENPPSMDQMLHIEAMDLIELETLRDNIQNAQVTLKQNVLDVLSPVINTVQRGAQ